MEKMQPMSFLSLLARADVFLVGSATAIIIFAIAISSLVISDAVQNTSDKPFSKVITVGPVWIGDTWICNSDAEFIIHAVLNSYEEGSRLEIFVSGLGLQPDFMFEPNEMKTFSIGGPANSSIRITNSEGTITGFITLQTTSGASAACENV